MDKWKQWARLIKRDAYALYLAARDPRVPWYAKVMAAAVAAYALSPIDLIPDFVPVLGYLDDLIIVPLGHSVGGVDDPAASNGGTSSRGRSGEPTPGKPCSGGSDCCNLGGVSGRRRLVRLPILFKVGQSHIPLGCARSSSRP